MLETNALNWFWLGRSGGHVTNHTVGAYSCLIKGGKQVMTLPFAALSAWQLRNSVLVSPLELNMQTCLNGMPEQMLFRITLCTSFTSPKHVTADIFSD